VTLIVVTEDELSECVALKLIGRQMANTDEVRLITKSGNGYLRSRMANFISVAERGPVLMLADLDRINCPPTLIRQWRRGRALPENLLLRVAVREIESWLLADREGFARYLSIAPQKITTSPEGISDPKHYLLNLARNAPRDLRSELLPAKGSIASQGFGYNSCLREFVAKMWSPTRAAERSQSLRRAINRVSELAAPNKHTRPAQGANT
jgi:hypothetical protein